MPRLNKTGPLGLGPRTGRGLGYCKDIKILEDSDEEEIIDKKVTEKDPVKKIINKFL